MDVRRKFSRGGRRRHFAYPFQVAIDAVAYAESFHGGIHSVPYGVHIVFGVFVTMGVRRNVSRGENLHI